MQAAGVCVCVCMCPLVCMLMRVCVCCNIAGQQPVQHSALRTETRLCTQPCFLPMTTDWTRPRVIRCPDNGQSPVMMMSLPRHKRSAAALRSLDETCHYLKSWALSEFGRGRQRCQRHLQTARSSSSSFSSSRTPFKTV